MPHSTVKAQTRILVVPDDYTTIQDAINNASAGDTVFVRAGNYDVNYSGIIIDKSISLIGENNQDTIIMTRQNFSLSWGIQITARNVTLSGFTIIGNTNVIVLGENSSEVANNIVNCTSGVAIDDDGSGIISSNTINSGEQGIVAGDLGSGTTGIESGVGINTTISNNIINGFGMGIQVWSDNLRILNNTITNNSVGLFVTTNPALLQDNNIVNTTAYGLYGTAYINASYNWWGTNDTQAISNSITTGNHIESSVTFIPYLTALNTQAMPLPNVLITIPTKSPASIQFMTTFPLITTFAVIIVLAVVILLILNKRHRKTANLSK